MGRTATKKGGPKALPILQKFYFNSVHELIRATEAEAETAPGFKYAFTQFYKGEAQADREQWTGGIRTADQYKELLKNGYLPAVNELGANATTQGNRNELTPSYSGQFFDVAAYVQGRPDCMAEFQTQETNQYLTINIDFSIGYDVKASTLMEKAKVIFNAINEIEAQGTRVKINMIAQVHATETKQRFFIDVKIKDFEENFIPSLHGLFIGHLATVRAIFFSYLSLYSKQLSIGGKELIKDREPGVIYLELTDTNEQLKSKLIL